MFLASMLFGSASLTRSAGCVQPGKHNIDGREVEVKAARPRVQGAMRTSRKIFVGGLPVRHLSL